MHNEDYKEDLYYNVDTFMDRYFNVDNFEETISGGDSSSNEDHQLSYKVILQASLLGPLLLGHQGDSLVTFPIKRLAVKASGCPVKGYDLKPLQVK